MTHFALTATDGAARAGVLRTAHGDVPTPAFMPVGTKATVKGLHPDALRALGAAIVLANTYHLLFRPGVDVVEELGGLHRFMGWDGPILTDSGGFQVFSLRDTIAAADDDGVTFRSVYDGEPGALHARARGRDPAPARLRHRDVPRRLPARRRPRAELERRRRADDAPGRGASSRRPRADGQLALRDRPGRHRPGAPAPLDRGDRRARLRRLRARRALASARTATRCSRRSRGRRRSCRPTGRATSWGSATRVGILEVIERGVDMFDCVLPTRLGRTGVRARRGRAGSICGTRASPATAGRSTRTATAPPAPRFSRAYLRHLVNQQELLGLILLSEHNVRFLLDLTAGARAAIERGRVRPHTRRHVLERLGSEAAAGQEAEDGNRWMAASSRHRRACSRSCTSCSSGRSARSSAATGAARHAEARRRDHHGRRDLRRRRRGRRRPGRARDRRGRRDRGRAPRDRESRPARAEPRPRRTRRTRAEADATPRRGRGELEADPTRSRRRAACGAEETAGR